MEQFEFEGFLGPTPKEKGKKFDDDKLRYELLPTRPLQEIVKVLTEGAKKYGARNWEKGIEWSFWEGEDTDPESGLSHLAHAGCNVLFLLFFSYRFKNLDDRPRGGKNGKKKINGVNAENDQISGANLESSHSSRRSKRSNSIAAHP